MAEHGRHVLTVAAGAAGTATRFHVSPGGWVAEVRHVPSPNFDARPDGVAVDLLVLHNISLPPGQFGTGDIDAFFQNRLDTGRHPFFETIRGVEVSAHFVIDRDGAVTQFVSCDARAWHAGQSRFGDRTRCNDFSIGVELEGTDEVPFTTAQYETLGALSMAIHAAYPIQAVVGHSDIAPGRKTDPGPCFDWKRYVTVAALAPSALPLRHVGPPSSGNPDA